MAQITQGLYQTYNGPIVSYKYNDKLYYYENNEIKIISLTDPRTIIKYPPVLGHISAFTVACFNSQPSILSINTYHMSSDHYFDKIYNKLIIVDCNTMAQTHILDLSEMNDIYITAITYKDSILTIQNNNQTQYFMQI